VIDDGYVRCTPVAAPPSRSSTSDLLKSDLLSSLRQGQAAAPTAHSAVQASDPGSLSRSVCSLLLLARPADDCRRPRDRFPAPRHRHRTKTDARVSALRRCRPASPRRGSTAATCRPATVASASTGAAPSVAAITSSSRSNARTGSIPEVAVSPVASTTTESTLTSTTLATCVAKRAGCVARALTRRTVRQSRHALLPQECAVDARRASSTAH